MSGTRKRIDGDGSGPQAAGRRRFHGSAAPRTRHAEIEGRSGQPR